MGLSGDDLDRDALDRDADRPLRLPIDDGNDRGRLLEPFERIGRGGDERYLVDDVAPAAHLARDVRAELACKRLGQLQRLVDQQPPQAPRSVARETREDLPLRLGADAPDVAQAARLGGRAQLVGGSDAELAAERDHPLRPEPDEPAEPDELRLDLALQLIELGDASRSDELGEAPLDAGSDAVQLAHTPGSDELRDRRSRLADQVGRAPVGADGVAARVGQVEERGIGIERLRDLRVIHEASLFP